MKKSTKSWVAAYFVGIAAAFFVLSFVVMLLVNSVLHHYGIKPLDYENGVAIMLLCVIGNIAFAGKGTAK